MDKYRIDSHKLIYHPQRVSDWLRGEKIFPIYIEISPSGACNHRCSYCALDFMGYKPRFLGTGLIKDRLSEMGRLGVKSVMYAGEGEPLLHKDIVEIINHTKSSGIDVAITTNGVLLNKVIINNAMKSISWVKVSINAASEETYKDIHGTSPNDLNKVINNLSYAVALRKQKGYRCALGMQLLLLPDNFDEVVDLAKKAREIGVDYLVVKPYSQHPSSNTVKYKNIKYAKFMYLAEKLQPLNTDRFNVIFRINAMKKWDAGKRAYDYCHALPFWAYIDSEGNVWGCSAYLKDKRFLCGNIYKNRFKNIWLSEKRKRLLDLAERKLDTENCRVNCRMDEINRYLWQLKFLPEHVNFI